ncbi:MAG: hypothetical protein ABTQ34_00975 [Bdellovibrionales bacterium]
MGRPVRHSCVATTAEAIQSSKGRRLKALDCHVASLLAMTAFSSTFRFVLPKASWGVTLFRSLPLASWIPAFAGMTLSAKMIFLIKQWDNVWGSVVVYSGQLHELTSDDGVKEVSIPSGEMAFKLKALLAF